MSTETEGEHSVQQWEDTSSKPSWKPKRSYTIEFLLSLSELEVCKKLPNGFDESLLSEFEETSYGTQDRQRVPGSSGVQGFRRTDYGSSVPARGDSASFSRGLNRWDSRSSGRSDTDLDSESGRRYGSQAGRSGPNSEHDGLLGSGSFPRPTGFATGAPVPRFRPNGNFHLSKSNEPYHPPRPYKALPHARRETNDSFNDETFGSADSTSEDRAEEEKKRRAEFELMRKEQQKALQEKQKSGSGKLEDPFSEIVGLLEKPGDRKTSADSDKVLKQVPRDDSSKLPVHSQAAPPRPLVPPGFVSSVVDKSLSAKSLVHGDSPEVGRFDIENSRQETIITTPLTSSSETQDETISSSAITKKLLDSSIVESVDTVKGSSLLVVSEVLENGKILPLDSEVTGHKLLGEPRRSTSILEKLFGNTSTASTGSTSNSVEGHNAKTDDFWSPNTLQSKFTHWFLEEDKKPLQDISSEKSNDLLSLIAGGEKGGSEGSDVKLMGPILPPEAVLGHRTPESAHSTAEKSVQLRNSTGPESKPAVLTCEDLEQSMLSEVGGSSPSRQPSGDKTSALDAKISAKVDNNASHHLLSLLQQGMGSKHVKSTSNRVETSFDKGSDHDIAKVDVIDENTSNGNADELNSSGKTLTLESLFGTAFMKELHSAQKNSGSARVDASEPLGLPFSVADCAPFPSSRNDIGYGLGNRDANITASGDGIVKFNEPGHWLGFSGKEVEYSKPPAEIDPRFSSVERRTEAGLPGEENLISSLGDPIRDQNSMLAPNLASYNKNFLSSLSNAPNVIEKLAVLGAALNDERSMIAGQDPSFLHDTYETIKPELPYQTMHQHVSSPQLRAAQMNPGRPLFHALDSHPGHLDPHLKFMPPDVSMHNQFPTNMSQHPPGPPHHSAGLPGFDQLVPPPMLQHIAGNLAPTQLLGGFPSGAPLPPHPGHTPAGYIPDHSPMQGFPFGQRQPHFGGQVMRAPGADLGGANNPPDAFQALLEMERRANPKQRHPPPFATGGHNRPMYGHELDMGFQYR